MNNMPTSQNMAHDAVPRQGAFLFSGAEAQAGLEPPRAPRVLNKHRDKIPAGAVYIGRPSRWGNPFEIGEDGNREEVVAKYRTWLMAQPDLIKAAQKELAGKDLVCFCAPKACHGDVLLEVANADKRS